MSLDQGQTPHDTHTNGSASARTVNMFPALATNDSEAITVDERHNLGTTVRKLLLTTGKPMTKEQIQDELGEPRHALGEIDAALVKMGARKTTVDGAEMWSLLSTEDAEKLLARCADVLVVMANAECTCCWSAGNICDEFPSHRSRPVEETRLDIDALVAAGVVMVNLNGGDEPYTITVDTRANILRLGAEAVARSTLSELALRDADRTEFERVATERLGAERKAKVIAQSERDKLATFLRENGQDVGAILSPPEPVTPGPKRDEFMFEKLVEWSDAVELDLRRKEAALRAKLELSRAALDAEKARHDGVRKGIEEELREIAQSIADKLFMQREQAYREPRWNEGVTLVVRISDGKILDRQPIAKGTQRALPIETSPKAESVVPPAKDEHDVAASSAATKQEARAAAVEQGPKGELTIERMLVDAETLLRGFGSVGLEWGKDGNTAVNALARRIHGKERGRLPGGLAAMARKSLDRLLGDGRAVRQGDAIVWAEVIADKKRARLISSSPPCEMVGDANAKPAV